MEIVVATRQGHVRGRLEDGVAVFLGIPYAADPVGEARFAPPSPAPSWDGVRDALDYGPTAPQLQYAPPYDRLLVNPLIPGTGCLNLNVWTPDVGARLPVMVWIHGGAFVYGSGAVPQYRGARFARDGVILVTINYRLGADGFLFLEDGCPNAGLLDQLAALEWVQENIAAFGGDPSRVTVAGESAGAMSVATLLSMPAARGLFQRAITESGAGHHVLSAATARRVAGYLAERLGVAPRRSAMARVPVERTLEAAAALAAEAQLRPDPERWGEITLNQMIFEPVVDGEVLPARPIDAIAAGAGSGVGLLTGTNADEQRFFLVPQGAIDGIDEATLAALATAYGLGPEAVDVYRRGRPGASPGDVLSAVVTDWFFRIPSLRLAEARAARGERVHVYEFTWPSPLFEGRLGSCHALEVPFAFDTLDAEGTERLTGPEPPVELASAMHRAWVDFVAGGDPSWPAYDLDRRPVMRFGERSGVEDDPGGGERRLWEGVR